MSKGIRVFGSAIAIAAMLLLAAPVLAQFGGSTGSIFGTVGDEQGGALPGVSVGLAGGGAPQSATTDAKGSYRFVNLAPAKYTVNLALTGFSSLTIDNVVVNLGGSTELNSKLKLSAVAASVTVTSEAPVINTRVVETGAAITHAELQDIPTARDPWVVLQSVPGVQIDRVNVAGSESGQQSVFTGKGSAAGTFTVDGVNLTDMSALGASAGYYDFDSFQEMNVITGGADPAIQGAGTHLTMVTKRGTNEVHGSARIFVVDSKLESKNLSPEQQATIGAGNKIDSLQDYGAELGGPVIKDRLWLWGSYGRDQINLRTLGGGPGGVLDRTTLEDFNGKLNAQIISSNSFNAWYLGSDKLKFGRGAGPQRPQPTTWDQTTPAHNWKFEDSQVFTSSLFASAQYNGSNNAFTLTPEGGLNVQPTYDANQVWANSYLLFSSPRPQRQAKFDTSYFFNTGNLGHELKAGFSYLNVKGSSLTVWPGIGNGFGPDPLEFAAQTWPDYEFNCGEPCAVITRDGSYTAEGKYYSAYFGDTITMDRLTVNLGVRWDQQFGSNAPSLIGANASFPAFMPALVYPGEASRFKWNDWQPRIGVNYAFGANRTTVLKASYAEFADALGVGTIATTNPLAGASYAWVGWTDANSDGFAQTAEVDPSNLYFSQNYNSADPGNPGVSTNGIQSTLNAPSTKEFLVGIDQEISPNFAVGVNYTYRKATDQLYAPLRVYDPTTGTVLSSADYEQYTTLEGTTPDGIAYSQPVYQIKPEVLNALGRCTNFGLPEQRCTSPSGSYTFNRGNFNQTYSGLEATFTKRLSDKWMARGNFVWNDNKQTVEGSIPAGTYGCIDPTNQLSISTVNAQTCRSDEFVAIQSVGSGSKGSVFLNSTWQFSFNALYQLPYNFTISTNVYGREGYPLNWYEQAPGKSSANPNGAKDRITRSVVVVPADASRYDNVFEWDLQVGYVIRVFGTGTVTLTGSCFNVTNQATVLQRFNAIGQANVNQIKEVQSPRVARFGVQISF